MLTPAVIIDYDIMINNLIRAQQKCNHKQVKLRPHFKAHKTPFLALIQKELGAQGFTTAKLAEAELLKKEGFKDLLVAYPVVTRTNAERLRELSKGITVGVIVDSKISVDILNDVFEGDKLYVYIKIDTGLNRCGLKVTDDITNFAKYIVEKPNLYLKGLLTHAGHSYKSSSHADVINIALSEGQTLIDIKKKLESTGIMVEEISVGSTPTFNNVLDINGVTEVRPGNYIFNDYTQVALKTTTIDNCALKVKSTVISIGDGKFIIDAGAKTLGLDKGTHGSQLLTGYGKILEYPEAEITGLSEEHGIVFSEGKIPNIGETITIIPNHSCVVMNLAPFVYMLKNGNLEKINNSGRGLNY